MVVRQLRTQAGQKRLTLVATHWDAWIPEVFGSINEHTDTQSAAWPIAMPSALEKAGKHISKGYAGYVVHKRDNN